MSAVNLERLLTDPSGFDLPASPLQRAKVDRPKLFAGSSKSRLRMRAHDLRATFITVSLASGRTWEWCQQRTGHGDSMKQKYRRTAATWIAQQQGDLAPMHLTIPELAAHRSITPRLPHDGGSRVAEVLPKSLKVHGKGLEPLCLSAAEPKADQPIEETSSIEETSPINDPGDTETARPKAAEGQSWGNQDPVEGALAKAIEGAAAAGRFDVVAQLVKELEARRLARIGNVVAIDGEPGGRTQ
jgi:hypothetical protein